MDSVLQSCGSQSWPHIRIAERLPDTLMSRPRAYRCLLNGPRLGVPLRRGYFSTQPAWGSIVIVQGCANSGPGAKSTTLYLRTKNGFTNKQLQSISW